MVYIDIRITVMLQTDQQKIMCLLNKTERDFTASTRV